VVLAEFLWLVVRISGGIFVSTVMNVQIHILAGDFLTSLATLRSQRGLCYVESAFWMLYGVELGGKLIMTGENAEGDCRDLLKVLFW
jgi:hypothetical protein